MRSEPTKPGLVIGIAGGSCSGKTTLVERLVRGPYGNYISLLPQDAYYHDASELQTTEGVGRNWDQPEALDNDLYLDHVARLLAGHPVHQPVYDFARDCRTARTVEVIPRRVLLLEGILVLAIPALRERIDLRVFLDTPADVRAIRRTLRDVSERGRTLQSIAEQYEQTVRPMHEQYVEPSRYHADVLIPWLNDNPIAVQLLTIRIAAAVGNDNVGQARENGTVCTEVPRSAGRRTGCPNR